MNKNGSLITTLPVFLLFLLSFLERTVLDLGPNIELLTSVMVLSAFFLKGKKTFFFTFLVIAFSDLIIGNTKIFLFTWSGFLLPSLVLPILSNKVANHKNKIFKGASLIFAGLSTNIFFYLWTNFGVWLLDTWHMYTKDISGLLLSYINGLPFLKNEVVSSLIFIPLGYIAISYSIGLMKKLNLSKSVKIEQKPF